MQEEEFRCISTMNKEDYSHWQAIRDAYRGLLDEGAYRSDKKYMTHNYSIHCINIYKNIDTLLKSDNSSKLTSHEAFLLNVAVILHDIYMTIAPDKRATHSKEAYELILHEINDNHRNVLNSYLRPSEAEQVADIILGHSNLKVDNGEEDTIKFLLDKYRKEPDDYEKNRICHLAAILRLADELDATQDRINRSFTEMNFDMNDKNDLESSRYYRKLRLIRKITENSEKNDELLLYVNEQIYGVENNEDSDLIVEVKNKIENELIIVDRVYVAFKQELSPFKRFLSVKVKAENDIILKEIEVSVERANKVKKKISDTYVNNKELEKLITDTVLNNGMFVSGHYIVNDKICSRDWIETPQLLNNKTIFDKIVAEFEKMIMTKGLDENIIMIGVGYVGLRIGSILAVRFNFPFEHVIPKHMEKYYDEHETRKIDIGTGKKYIIVTDVVITGNTIAEICSKHDIKYCDIVGIYSIFRRNCNPKHIEVNREIISHVNVINNQFDAEVRKKDSCKLRNEHGRCICKNKIIV